jgi:hypothetical protein
VAAARVKWHGQDLPVVREIVRIGGVETMVEIPGLDDPDARRIIATLAAIPKFEGAGKLAPVYLLEQVAALYIKHGGTPETWRKYETRLGIPRSRTKQPISQFQPFLRWANGGKPDTTGRLAKLAATLDEWVGLGDKRPSPITSAPGTSELAEWLEHSRGYTNIAERRREPHDENYSESESANVVPFDRRTDLRAVKDSRERPYSWRFPTATGEAQQRGASSARHTSMPSGGTVFGEAVEKPEQSRIEEPQGSLADLIGKVTHGDCLEIMSLIPHKSIKSIITSPPYNLRNSTGGGLRNGNGGKWPNATLLHGSAGLGAWAG